MGSNGAEHVKMSASDTTECSEATVEIKIKTLDSQTYTLRVDKCVPVPELKEQIASVTGVLSEQQRLICRGKVLKDDQLLSAYHVEDGHTLHLVVRQPLLPSLDTSADTATDPSSTAGRNPGSHVSPGVLIGTFNMSEHRDGTLPDLNRIISAVLNSVGGTGFGGGGEGIDLNQFPSELLTNAARRSPFDQTTSTAVPIDTMQPPVIPDSVTTLLQYLSQLRQDFLANAGGHSANAQDAGLPGSDRLEFEAALNSSETRRLLTPESLANVVSSMRQLLLQPVSECLEQLSGQLESQSSVIDPVERSRIQNRAIRSGVLYQNLGALLLELGRAIMTLRMGQTPADALVNAGPPVFISSAGPNPIMVQPLPFQPGTTVGSPVLGNSQHGSSLTGGSIGAGSLPRNIDIRIRTGSLLSRRDPAGLQTQGQASIPSDSTRQDAAPVNHIQSSGNRGSIPIRTVAASVPASVGRGADSSRSPVGIIFPVLARLQAIPSGTSNGSIPSQASDQQLGHDSAAAQYQNVAGPGGNGNSGQGISSQNVSGGVEQLLSTVLPGEHVIQDYSTPRSAAEPAQNNGTSSQESESFVSDEGLLLSLMLRQVLPMLSNNAGAGTSAPSTDGANSDETQVDESPAPGAPRRHGGPQTQPGSKRRRRE